MLNFLQSIDVLFLESSFFIISIWIRKIHAKIIQYRNVLNLLVY